MEIVNFFEKLAGKWFSQRTTHYLGSQQSKAGKADVEAEFCAASTPEVQQLCQALSLDPSLALCGLKLNQKITLDGDTSSQTSSMLVVPLVASHGSGQLLSQSGRRGSTPLLSQYRLDNEILTISTVDNDTTAEERWWFVTENLRMRTHVLKRPDGFELASFCSEIRLGVTKPPAPEN
jgi:CpeS-like protein